MYEIYIVITSLAKEVATLLKKLWTDWDEILWRGPE